MSVNSDFSPIPTIFHITHEKSGSQWIRAILTQCFPDIIVNPHWQQKQFFVTPLQEGKIYPGLFISKEEFYRVNLPSNYKKIIVIRDLRDTFISLYFSLKISHVILNSEMKERRETLNSLSINEGLKFMINSNMLNHAHDIQTSWIDSKEKIIKYEDLLENDEQILDDLLINDFKLPISRKQLKKIIIDNKFKNVSGRDRGIEDITTHYRKGIQGDWQNYFTPEIKLLFKDKYGIHLVKTGYEYDSNW
ncbi:sulfotransferase domain-containing protein [Priestia megaterium]|uniref:sulfotransferase domain-containing protein n=1 Tax=Priestia megaterium TaxID=1404 RepID=UPI002452AEFA|nr:sulfotransferase domain-containing protein [Priestia megaterium]MDH3183719.1 sulfotransferase domain-containing protein [Priestia megaterium]